MKPLSSKKFFQDIGFSTEEQEMERLRGS